MNFKFVYKICKSSEWEIAKKKGKFLGTEKDKLDGYLHFSDVDQIHATLKKHYKNLNELVLLKIETSKLDSLIWEQSSDGNFFPHLYSHLETTKVLKEYDITLNKDGTHKLPLDF